MTDHNAAEDLQEDLELAQETDEPTEQSAADESSHDDSPETSASQTEEQPKRYQKRIDQFRARLTQAEQRAARAEAELEELRQQESKPAEPAPEPPPRPKRDDFKGDAEAYAEALGDWTDRRLAFEAEQREARQKSEREAEEKRQQKQKVTERQKQQLAMLEKGMEAHEDYEDVVFDPTLSISEDMLEIATDMENGHDVLYALAQNPKEAARIAQMSDKQAALAMGQFVATSSKPGKRSSKAPDPPNPAKGGGDRPDRGDLRDDLSTEEWAKRFRKRLAKQRQG